MASRGAALPGRGHEEVPQTEGEFTAAEAAEKSPGPAPYWRSLVIMFAGVAALCFAGALLCWAGRDATPVGHDVFGRLVSGGHRLERMLDDGSHRDSEGCSGYHENCLDTRCCKESDEECFEKDTGWAQCLKTCLNTPSDPWECEVLGTQDATKENGTKGDPGCAEKGENCLDSRCCADPEQRCYVKEEGWAGCRQMCEEGKHDPEGPDDTPWSCADPPDIEGSAGSADPADIEEKEGPGENETEREEKEKHRRVKLQPCNWIGENCNASKCCNDPGMMCYAKNPYWAECLEACEKGENDTAGPDELPWSCESLGMRTAATVKETQVNGACTVSGEDCSWTKCCEDISLLCYEKNASFSGCRAECEANLYDPTGTDWLPWTCVVKSAASPTASKPNGQARSADNLIGVALAAIQEEIEEMDIKEMMARAA